MKRVVLVGGHESIVAKLDARLRAYNLTIGHHTGWQMARSKMPESGEWTAVLCVSDMVGHGSTDTAAAWARERGVPIVSITRKWAESVPALIRAGLLPASASDTAPSSPPRNALASASSTSVTRQVRAAPSAPPRHSVALPPSKRNRALKPPSQPAKVIPMSAPAAPTPAPAPAAPTVVEALVLLREAMDRESVVEVHITDAGTKIRRKVVVISYVDEAM